MKTGGVLQTNPIKIRGQFWAKLNVREKDSCNRNSKIGSCAETFLGGNPEVNQQQTFAVPQTVKSPRVTPAASNDELTNTGLVEISKEELERQERLEKAQKKKLEAQVRSSS